LTRRRRRNGNGNDNGDANHFFKIGTCPICGRENVQLSEHHIYKKAVFGDSDKRYMLCRDCHDVIEFVNRVWENMVLRTFMFCYRKTFNAFLTGNINGLKINIEERIDEEALIQALMPTVLRGFEKIEKKGINPWLEDRIANKGVYVAPRNKNKNNGH
jgi:hypothetical protein